VISGVFVVLSTTPTDIGSRTQLPSEKKVVLTNETQMRVALYQALSHGTHSEMPNWLQHKVRDITHAIDEEIAISRAFTITADQGHSNAGQNIASYQRPSLPETAQTDPPLRGAASRSAPNVLQVQKRGSKMAAGESSAADLESYISRGDQLVANGDVAGARVFYQRAAEYGSAIAAQRLGATYDPKILAQARLPALLANEDAARLWYKLAQGLRDNNR